VNSNNHIGYPMATISYTRMVQWWQDPEAGGGEAEMSRVLDRLLELLELEVVDEDVFRGASQDLGWGTVFGGQVLGQALAAAGQTVAAGRDAHSLHAYFLRPGDPARPITYHVERTRDGAAFSTRRIRAQQDGPPIFLMAASFQRPEGGLDHQAAMPEVPGPDGLASYDELTRLFLEQVPEPVRKSLDIEWPFEMRPVEVGNPLAPRPTAPVSHLWLRSAGPLPDDDRLHRCLLAYASDFSLLDTSLAPHGRSYWQGNLKMASLDHAMWFHRSFRADDWLLHAMVSPNASGSRGLVRGEFFDRSGRLVASTAQEGMIRDLR
jgi:acyl-CoA thioesterase-2